MFVEWLARLWAVTNPLPKKANIIVLVAHGATENRPTNGASAATSMVRREIAPQFPDAKIFFGVFTNFSDNQYIEKKFKSAMMPGAIFIGPVISTIEECLAVKKSLPAEFEPKVIIVVTDEAHSRRCRIVWRTFFQKSDIRIVAIPLRHTTDSKSPMRPYHYAWATLLFHALPTPYFWYLAQRGPEYMATKATSLHQPTVK